MNAPLRKLQFAFALGLLVFLCGCGPTVHKGKAGSKGALRTIAVLPLATSGEMTRERKAYLRAALSSELEARGFVLLDENLVDRLCPEGRCLDSASLERMYDVDALALMTVDSVYQTNFLVGNYNAINGTVSLRHPNGGELLSVKATASGRGGLLFNSGQVIEGLKTTVGNTGDRRFLELADQFVKKTVRELPKPEGGPADDRGKLALQSVELTPEKGDARYRVCASGTSGASAYLVLAGRRSTLRESQPGRYCGVFPLGWLAQLGEVGRVELRSSIGDAVSGVLKGSQPGGCDPVRGVQRLPASLARACVAEGCEGELLGCRAARLIVFRGDSEAGPFSRAGEVPLRGPWRDASETKAVYAVVAVAPDGAVSMPALFANR